MTNFKADILTEAGDEPILAIVVGATRSWYDEEPHNLGTAPVSWELAAPVLDYEYSAGFGSQDCHDIIAWTATKVLSIHEYDGSTSVISVPRNPENAL